MSDIIKVRKSQPYNGCWIDLFSFVPYEGPNHGLHITFKTPDFEYNMSKEDFKKFRKMVNEVIV